MNDFEANKEELRQELITLRRNREKFEGLRAFVQTYHTSSLRLKVSLKFNSLFLGRECEQLRQRIKVLEKIHAIYEEVSVFLEKPQLSIDEKTHMQKKIHLIIELLEEHKSVIKQSSRLKHTLLNRDRALIVCHRAAEEISKAPAR